MTMHACPVPLCSVPVRQGIYMCARHWRMVPKPLQAAVYESFRAHPGISENHLEALRIATEAQGTRAGMPPGTKALTVWQPWASLIMLRGKPFEFRKWAFTDKPNLAKLVGQRIVIHAGARKPTPGDLDDILDRIEEGESALVADIAHPLVSGLKNGTRSVPLSAALGSVVLGQPENVVDLFSDKVADSDRLDQHMYGWPMGYPEPFEQPIPAAGAQGFWNWS